jgi:transcriptional regulator with XRE-family HTH domain
MVIIIRGRIITIFRSLLGLKKTSLQVLGERIRAARKDMGLSQEDLALESDIDRSYIGGVERGQRNLSFRKLCAIAWVIHRDVGVLCNGLPMAHEKPQESTRTKWL